MTTKQILRELSRAGKPTCRMQLHRYLRRFNISALGVRQRPQQYPADSADVILLELGLIDRIEIPGNGRVIKRKKNGRLVSTQRLMSAAKKARRGK